MKTTIYISVRFILLAILLAITGFVYERFFWIREVKEKAPLLLEVQAKSQTADILYFAESSNITYADTDSLKLKISELTQLYLPGCTIQSIDQPAGHARNYLGLIKNLPRPCKTRVLVVTMNLRSFDAAWIHSELENNLNMIDVYYERRHPLIKKIKLNLGAYEKKTKTEREAACEHQWRYDTLRFPFEHGQVTVRAWDNFIANGYYKNDDSSWNMPKISLACHYVKGYAFQIDTLTNPRIKDFDAIVAEAKKRNLTVVFNLMAENMEYADSLVGYPLTFLMKQNRDLLVSRYTRMGATVVDHLERVPGAEFIDQNWTTEHYFYKGRNLIAQHLAEALKKHCTNNNQLVLKH